MEHPLRIWRKNQPGRRGLMLVDLSDDVGICVPTLSAVERKWKKISARNAKKLADHTGLPRELFLYPEEHK